MGMVLEGEGQFVHQFLGSCSVTDRPRQARRAVIAAPRDMPGVATNSLSLLSDLWIILAMTVLPTPAEASALSSLRPPKK